MDCSGRELRGVGTIDYENIDPSPAFVPLAKNLYRSDKLDDMGKLAGLLECSAVRGDTGDRPESAFFLPPPATPAG
jgi:hypothetical protein